MIQNVKEFCYLEGEWDSASKIFTQEERNKIRKIFKGNCVEVAGQTARDLLKQNILATTIMFKSRGNCFMHPIKVYNELTENVDEYTHHSVVLFGDCCLDLLHSDRIIPIKEYVEKLEELNPDGLRLDSSSSWFDDKGYPFCPTIEQVKNYEFVIH